MEMDRMAVKTVDHKEKIVVADNKKSLLAAAAKVQQGNQELFFKYRLRFHRSYAGSVRNPRHEFASEITMDGLRIHMRGAGDFYGITPEFAMLCDIHNAVPENAVKPLALVRSSNLWKYDKPVNSVDGCSVAGYITEYAAGQTLAVYYKKAQSGDPVSVGEFAALLRQYIEVLNRLGARGIGHGDAHFGNVIIGHNGILKLVDPMPINPDPRLNRIFTMSEDMERISVMEGMLRRIARKGIPD